jgi:hypothetical protein
VCVFTASVHERDEEREMTVEIRRRSEREIETEREQQKEREKERGGETKRWKEGRDQGLQNELQAWRKRERELLSKICVLQQRGDDCSSRVRQRARASERAREFIKNDTP